MATFQIKLSTDNQYYYVLRATGNNEIILTGERHTTKMACTQSIASVKSNAPFDARYQRLTAGNGQYYFNLKAGNGEKIGMSEMYNSITDRDRGVELVKAQAPTAGVVDLT